jgi:hypothetical protein
VSKTSIRRERGIVRDIDCYELAKYQVKIPIHFNKNTGEFFGEYLQWSQKIPVVCQ